MRNSGTLDSLPLWGVFGFTLVIIFLSIEAGFRLGRSRWPRVQDEIKEPLNEIVAAMLGLLALMLGFTFSLASTRYDIRLSLVADEANAIGTTYLRADLLPPSDRAEIRRLLREYLEVRLEAARTGDIAYGIAQSQVLQTQLWARAAAIGRENPGLVVISLFIVSLNETIDLHDKRVAMGIGNRIPPTIWYGLYIIAVVSIGTMGYRTGVVGARKFLAFIPLVLTFSVSMLLIADLDRPREGLIKTSQKPLMDTLNAMKMERGGAEVPRDRQQGQPLPGPQGPPQRPN